MQTIKVPDECYEAVRKEAEKNGVSIRRMAARKLMGISQPEVVKNLKLIEALNREISLLQDLVLKGFWTPAEKLRLFSCIDRLKAISSDGIFGGENG